MKNFTFTLLFSAFSLLATAQTFDDNFFNNFEKTYQKDPVQFLKSDNTPDFTIVYGDGRLGDKESVLKIYEALNQVSRTVTELKTRQLGNTGIATGILNHNYTAKQDGSPRNYTNRFTHTFTLQKGKWHLVAVHFTDMPPMPPFTEKMLRDINSNFVTNPEKLVKDYVAPDFVMYGNEGKIYSYEETKNIILNIKHTRFDDSEVKIQQFGNVAIATGVKVHEARLDSQTVRLHERYTNIYQFKGGKWLWTSVHYTTIVPLDQNKGQTIQKGNMLGIHTFTVELKPNVTMEQVLEFYKTKWAPAADQYFGFKCFFGKCSFGDECAENKIIMIFHHKTEADRNKYFKMAEGGRDLNELGKKAWAQFAPTNDALQKLATVKDEWADWVIK